MQKVTEQDVEYAVEYAAEVHGDDCGGHDILHIKRVIQNARRILRDYPLADGALVLLCCALHDVDDKKLTGSNGFNGSRLDVFFKKRGYEEELCGLIRHMIGSVSFSDNPHKDPSLPIEAQILQDADRLDALGAVGIGRAFAYGGSRGRAMYGGASSTVAHFYDKLFKLPELMNTPAAKRTAVERADFMREFLERLSAEAGE